ncbi:unnamed protein product [Danaus chrysippus]|uniref:(African queen) hypothetical protein n=1 Tax=Danaus chrysippus TaxID=151541 RepID=A0A8J2QTG0_9NEOP|nr:unnamed protein product [Danaus chrysippus]
MESRHRLNQDEIATILENDDDYSPLDSDSEEEDRVVEDEVWSDNEDAMVDFVEDTSRQEDPDNNIASRESPNLELNMIGLLGLNNLKEPMTIIMDNAPYHSVQVNKTPNQSNRKSELVKWLNENGVTADIKMLKAELIALVRRHKPSTPTYALDEMAKEKGHQVLRLPLSFNAIELIWAQIKSHTARNNTSPPFTANKMLALLQDAINKVQPEDWSMVVNKIKRDIMSDWDRLSPGRPQKSFIDSSERSKRRKTKHLRSKELAELTYATQMQLRREGKVEASKVVKDLSRSPQRKQYERMRETNPSFFPCYSILQKAKKDCYPEIRVTETCAEVQVQKLMDHTVSRLIQLLGEAVEDSSEEEKCSLLLFSKWGCDGSQQVQYKMKFEYEDDSDANIFQSSVVPLQLIYGPEKKYYGKIQYHRHLAIVAP